MSTDSHREIIANLPLFKAFPDQLTQRIAAVFEEVSEFKKVGPGTRLFGVDDQESNDGYILLEGSVSIVKRVSPPFKAEAPVLLGEMKLFNPDNERSADVTATEALEVLHFDWDSFYDLRKERLAKSEYAIFGRALQDYSWLHFLGDDI